MALALLVAVAAAIRSTWSPCGLSMLSSITPFGERARGHRYWATATWFVLGAAVGGACLGGVAATCAAGARAIGLTGHRPAVYAVLAVAALLAAAVDAGVFGEIIPMVRRQVDDRWLSRYRPWVYAGGFGWQIGAGVVTYVMTSAVFLLVVMAVLTGSPLVALLLVSAFGLVRGSTVLLTSRAGNPGRLRALHMLVDRLGQPVRVAVIGVQLAVAVDAGWQVGPAAGVAVLCLAAVAAGVRLLRLEAVRRPGRPLREL